MPPPLNVVPTDFARYWSNGTGRDSYITANNGGLTGAAATERFHYQLRGAPDQRILLPSFVSGGGALAQEALAATYRADPKLRAQRAHQRAVSSYLHESKSSRGTLSKSAAWRERTGTQQVEAGFGTTGRYVPIPVLGLPPQQWLALTGREAKMQGSMSARLPSKAEVVHNPYQRSLMARSWGEAESLRATGRASRKLRVTQVIAETESRPRIPIAQRPMPRPEKPLTQPHAQAPHRAPAAAAATATAAAEAQASPRFVPAPPAQPSPPRQQQQFTQIQQMQQSQQLPQQQQQPQQQQHQSHQPPQPQAHHSHHHPQQFPPSHALYVPHSPPSYRVTLPKQMGTYCDGAMTHHRLPDYNQLPSAGQLTARLREKALLEQQVPMLC